VPTLSRGASHCLYHPCLDNFQDCARMTDELWRHALKTLDSYPKQKCEIQELYNHEDQTGILERHKKVLQLDNGRKPDPKTMYHELIRMLVDHERSHCDQIAYKEIKDVSKIQGYQDLTNKLLRNINEKLAEELAIVSDKLARVEKVMGISDDDDDADSEDEEEVEDITEQVVSEKQITVERKESLMQASTDVTSGSKSGSGSSSSEAEDTPPGVPKKKRRKKKKAVSLAEKVAMLEKTAQGLEKSSEIHEKSIDGLEKETKDIKCESNRMDEDIRDLQDKIKTRDEADGDLKSRQDEVMETQKSLMEVLEKRLDTNEEHIALLQDNDAEQDAKIVGLEKADAFLQDTYAEGAKKTDSLEEELKEHKHVVDKFREELMEELSSDLTDKVEEVAKETKEIKEDVEEFKDRLDRHKEDIEETTEVRFEEVRQLFESESGEKAKETGHKFDELNGLIRKMEDELRDLNGTAANNANDINELKENDNALDARLEKIETEAGAMAADLAETQTNQDETLSKTVEDLAELKSDLIRTADKLKESDDARKEQEDKIEGLVTQNPLLQENTILVKQLRSDLDGLELTVVNNTKAIEDGNAVIKRNTEQLIPLVPLAEDITDLTAKVNNLENEVNNANLDLEATDKRQQSALDELERKFNVCKADIEDLEDKQRVGEEKLFGLEEANVAHLERATYVEQLRGELGAINEQKQQSEARLKDEMDRSFSTVEELRELLDNKIDNLEEKANIHQGEIQEVRERQSAFETTVAEMNEENGEKFGELAGLEALVRVHDRDIKQMLQDLEKVPTDVEANVNLRFDEVSKAVDEKIAKMDDLSKDNAKNVDNLRELNSRVIDKMKEQVRDDIDEHGKLIKENAFEIGVLKDNLKEVNDTITADLAKADEVEVLQEARKDLEVKVKAIEDKVDVNVAQTSSEISQISQLVVNVQQDVGDVSSNLNKTRDSIKNLRTEVDTNQQDTWKLFNQVYSTLRGYTVVLRSSGGAANHQPSCLGVYRLIDSLNDRPVYKQEGGENYLYYCSAKSSWMVGTNVGDSYAWIKHSDRSEGESSSSSSSSSSDSDSSAGSSDSASASKRTSRGGKRSGRQGDRGKKTAGHSGAGATRGSPELLKPGCWKYKPNGFELSQLSDDDNIWMQDDVTLKVEALKDVTLIGDIIREIKISKEVD